MNPQQIQSQVSNNTNEQLPFPIKKEQQQQQQNFSLRHEIPPWLSCTSFFGPQPIDLITSSTSPPSLFQDFQHNQDHHDQNQNPNPSNSLGPTALPSYHDPQPPSPHLSATALLQKAAQIGAKGISSRNQCAAPAGVFVRPHQTHMSAADSGQNITARFGLNLPSRTDELISGLTSFGNKTAAMTGGVITGASGGDIGNNNINNNDPLSSSSSSFLHDMIMNNPDHPLICSITGRFEEDMHAFGGIFNHPVAAKKLVRGANESAWWKHWIDKGFLGTEAFVSK